MKVCLVIKYGIRNLVDPRIDKVFDVKNASQSIISFYDKSL